MDELGDLFDTEDDDTGSNNVNQLLQDAQRVPPTNKEKAKSKSAEPEEEDEQPSMNDEERKKRLEALYIRFEYIPSSSGGNYKESLDKLYNLVFNNKCNNTTEKVSDPKERIKILSHSGNCVYDDGRQAKNTILKSINLKRRPETEMETVKEMLEQFKERGTTLNKLLESETKIQRQRGKTLKETRKQKKTRKTQPKKTPPKKTRKTAPKKTRRTAPKKTRTTRKNTLERCLMTCVDKAYDRRSI